MRKNLYIIPIITSFIFLVGYIILNILGYNYTSIPVYTFITFLFIEFMVIFIIKNFKKIILCIISSIGCVFFYALIIIIMLSFYGWDERIDNRYVIKRTLLDFKPIKEISRSPNKFIKSKYKEFCNFDICDYR